MRPRASNEAGLRIVRRPKKITVTIMGDASDWATPEQFASMTDAEVVELVRQDVLSFVECATWLVERT